mgnify:FL=1
MRTKTQILLLTIFGNVLIAGIFLILSEYRTDKQQRDNLAASAGLYQQAWDTMANDAFSLSIGEWHPQTGLFEKRDVWQENSNFAFPEGLIEDGEYKNPILNSIALGDSAKIETVFSAIFSEPLEFALMSFVLVLDTENALLYCGTSFEGYGVDPCSENASYDFSKKVDAKQSRANIAPVRISRGNAKRTLVRINDSSGAEESNLNDALFIDIKSEKEKLGTVIIGKNVFEMLETFEYEFQVKTQLSLGASDGEAKISGLDAYYPVDDFSEIGEVEGLSEIVSYALENNRDSLLKSGKFGHLDIEAGLSIYGFPLSSYAKMEKAQLMILKNEREMVAAMQQDFLVTLGIAAAVFAGLVALVSLLTGYAFGGISRAVGVLQSLTKGDLAVDIPKNEGFLRSKDDEVAQLGTAFTAYKDHLMELEDIKADQLEKRKARDTVIVDKMGALATQLEGDARKMILDDIERMEKGIHDPESESSEEASTEMMTFAFSRMSDEVSSLIEARTKEIKEVAAKNEELLLNILPGSIVPRMMKDEKNIADSFEECSILFGDIVGFTPMSQKLDPKSLVQMLNEIFTTFDDFSDEMGLEKIKTIGDSYMVACGVPNPDPDHANKIAEMGLKMIRYVDQYPDIAGQKPSIRIGIHSGPLVAGVIGKRKFIYDLWGDAVNTAARMEAHGVPNVIQLTAQTAERLAPQYKTQSRGLIDIKGKGEMETFLLYPDLPKAQ